jgi:hypothetical protein
VYGYFGKETQYSDDEQINKKLTERINTSLEATSTYPECVVQDVLNFVLNPENYSKHHPRNKTKQMPTLRKNSHQDVYYYIFPLRVNQAKWIPNKLM